MLIKMWAAAVLFALTVAPSLAAGSDPAGAGPNPNRDNATTGTAASGANTPSGKMDASDANAKSEASHSGSTGKGNDPTSK
jgi:hypothetical protein